MTDNSAVADGWHEQRYLYPTGTDADSWHQVGVILHARDPTMIAVMFVISHLSGREVVQNGTASRLAVGTCVADELARAAANRVRVSEGARHRIKSIEYQQH